MITRKEKISGTGMILFMLFSLISCTSREKSNLSEASIIPKPVSITATGDYFKLKENTVIYYSGDSTQLRPAVNYLAGRLKPATGFRLEVRSAEKPPASGIYLSLNTGDTKTGEEGYEISITGKLLHLSAAKPAGLFMGIQTIRQLLPATIEAASKQEGPWEIATGTISDYPEYSYRGAALDVSRHFFGVGDVERYIEYITYYKMNTLHLHLSDDQGWRIEIKSWPNLAEHGGSTQVGGGQGGYYTQEQYKEIVRFAKDHFVTIVPEIDMPGHTNAALASYAELNCNGKATELYTGTKVGFSTLCTKKDVTYKFVDDVVREISELTEGPYFHIGGDESHSTKREDYIPFINRVQEIVLSHNKKVIGWDDISIATLKPNSVAQHWANVKNAQQAVAQGAKIILSPATKTYLDMQYDSTSRLGLHWAGYTEVDSSYIWDPAKLIPGITKENILGIEAPLWTETITNMDDIEYMVFPRLPGLAEIGWTPSAMRSWDEYKLRLADHAVRFRALGINFYPSKRVPWKQAD